MAKNGTGSKAPNRGDDHADAQIERANSTSAMFLGAGNRGYSWLNGDFNWTPRSNPSKTPASNARDGPENQIQAQAQKGGNAVPEGTSITCAVECTVLQSISSSLFPWRN